MYTLSAAQIADICAGTIAAGRPDAQADSACIDSRLASNGSLFAAFKGEKVDGHAYIEVAVSAGATIILASGPDIDYSKFADRATTVLVDDVLAALQALAIHQRAQMTCPVIGITGSSGKTSTKELLKGALEASLNTIATEGNYNNELGVPLTLLRATPDTEAVVLEMGMRGLGQITELTDIGKPTMSIITTIGDAHIEMLGSRENIARAKGEIFEALTPDQLAFMPAQVDFGDYLRSVCKAPLITVAVESPAATASQKPGASPQGDVPAAPPTAPPAEYTAHITSYDPYGCASAKVALPSGEVFDMTLAIPGQHSVQNALLALATAQALGVDAQTAIRGLEGVQPAEMRMQRAQVSNVTGLRDVSILVDCYNANPESTAASMKTLAVSDLPDTSQGLRVAVLGDMLEMGQHSAKVHKDTLFLAGLLGLDLVYTFGPAYSQATQDLLNEVNAGRNLNDIPELRSFTDMDVLISSLGGELTSGSLLLVKGSRGMQMERIVDALTEGDKPC